MTDSRGTIVDAARHLQMAEQQASQIALDRAGAAEEFRLTAVVGGGTMGRGIAISLLDAGRPVRLLEVDEASVQNARAALESHYESAVRRGRLSAGEKDQRLAAIDFVTDYDRLGNVDLVIEAVFEDMVVKQQVFRQLDKVCKPGAVLASNTSFQDIDQLAAATSRPTQVLGMHYFSPANKMKLLEVVRGAATSEETLARALALGKACGKIPVVSGVCYGFIGNRINRRLQQQAQLCLLEGATPADVDTAMEKFGMAMGPLAVGDLAGLDIGYTARKALTPEQKGDPKTYWIPDALVEMGRLGQKSGSGYYRYLPDDRTRHEDPEVIALVKSASTHFGYERNALEDAEIVERLLLSVVNEAAKVLEEGIAARSGDIDVVYVHGYGFPASHGGIMYWADELGLDSAREKLDHYHGKTGDENLRPAPLVIELGNAGKRFSNFNSRPQ